MKLYVALSPFLFECHVFALPYSMGISKFIDQPHKPV